MNLKNVSLDRSVDHVIDEIQDRLDQLKQLRHLQKLIAPKPPATHLDVIGKDGCKAAVPTIEQSKLHGSN
jgi:hypothetical protein